ncbi:asparagine synthase (glutamine-hydrolyzing) [Oryzomonas rubra]|uniref:asparagine synthase (glutamine-hydrolyzing) n=1 Tax=Oryzomonas rubra TaxID=2509454 RepID=A0A5A9XE33_9BACT|nr:asparagine synthase (glutamine-hydrolyzing) [Oryzomonas rubra]KAA0890509.1 asparagine synthase (glutamine-hydrolyzing) [Oryzomonas rubra]
MCGIVGKYFFHKHSFNANDLSKMMEAIYHRGPDSSGVFLDERVALGFRRLSIIDTASGHQPLFNETNDIVLMANGEIYNYKDLTSILLAKGHLFKTKSDCEVIIHLYEEYGSRFVEKLNGMFSFCLYDQKKQLLMIARDRVGIKPMYFYKDSDVIIFGSEIKGILAANEVNAIEEDNILGEYLCFRYLANRRTFFAGIKSLDPGTYIELSPGGYRFVTFGSTLPPKQDYEEIDLLDKLENYIYGAVERQMMTDVPLGTQLSGGVDSSLVSALAGKLIPGLKTFTVGFHEAKYDETPFAKLLAETSGFEYHEIKIDNRTFSDVLPKVIWFHDEPLCHANSVQMYLLCRYAREHVKVMLTGEGADELFAGYPRYMISRIGELYNKCGALAKPFKVLLNAIPIRKAKKIADNLGLSDPELILWNAAFVKKDKAEYLLDIENINLSARTDLLEKSWDQDLCLFDNLLSFERKSYLQPILMRQDKMSMAASIESRVPILDNEMVKLSDSIPYHYKIRKFTPKYIFKKVAARHIPKQIVYKKKVGFGVPIDDWLRDKRGLGKYLDMLLDMSDDINCINTTKLERIIMEHRNNNINHGDVLWPMVNYVIWKDKFIR